MKNFILLALQFLLLLYIIFLSGPYFIFTVPFVVIQALSVLLIFWAILVKKLHKKPVFSGGVYLLKEGPYEFIRHPVYVGLLLFVSTYVQEYFTPERFVAFLLFVALVLVQVRSDEKLTKIHFKHEYSSYKKKTKKLIPYVY